MGYDLLGNQTDFDLDIYVTLTVKVKLLNVAKNVITFKLWLDLIETWIREHL